MSLHVHHEITGQWNLTLSDKIVQEEPTLRLLELGSRSRSRSNTISLRLPPFLNSGKVVLFLPGIKFSWFNGNDIDEYDDGNFDLLLMKITKNIQNAMTFKFKKYKF